MMMMTKNDLDKKREREREKELAKKSWRGLRESAGKEPFIWVNLSFLLYFSKG